MQSYILINNADTVTPIEPKSEKDESTKDGGDPMKTESVLAGRGLEEFLMEIGRAHV